MVYSIATLSVRLSKLASLYVLSTLFYSLLLQLSIRQMLGRQVPVQNKQFGSECRTMSVGKTIGKCYKKMGDSSDEFLPTSHVYSLFLQPICQSSLGTILYLHSNMNVTGRTQSVYVVRQAAAETPLPSPPPTISSISTLSLPALKQCQLALFGQAAKRNKNSLIYLFSFILLFVGNFFPNLPLGKVNVLLLSTINSYIFVLYSCPLENLFKLAFSCSTITLKKMLKKLSVNGSY